MTKRRAALVLGLGGLVLSALSRAAYAGPAAIDVEGYGGSSVGQWTCGPTARANYGGVGGHVRYYPEEPPPREVEAAVKDEPDLEPNGLSIGAGGGAEHRSFTRVACEDSPCSAKDVMPPARVLGAGRASLGYDSRYIGFRLGALAFQRWDDNTDSSPTTAVLPDIDLRIGRRAGFHGGLGLGAYNVSTIFRPGGHLGLGYASGRWAAELRSGVHLTFDDELGVRGDLSARYSVNRVVAPGLGFAVSSAEQISPEGRLFVVITP